jgi:hypothetical protein
VNCITAINDDTKVRAGGSVHHFRQAEDNRTPASPVLCTPQGGSRKNCAIGGSSSRRSPDDVGALVRRKGFRIGIAHVDAVPRGSFRPKQGSVWTFQGRPGLSGSADFGGAGAAGQLGFYRVTKALGSLRMLALKMQSDAVEFIIWDGLLDKGTVGRTTFRLIGTQAQIARMRMNHGIRYVLRVARIA